MRCCVRNVVAGGVSGVGERVCLRVSVGERVFGGEVEHMTYWPAITSSNIKFNAQ